MTDARDELAELIRTAIKRQDDGYPGIYVGGPEVLADVALDGHADLLAVADAILAAGWRAPEPDHEWSEDSCVRCGMRYDQSAGTFCPQAVAVTHQEHADDDDEYGEWEKIHPDDDLDG